MGVSVEEVLSELGWKDGFRIPVANEENRRLEIELEKKTKRKAELSSEVEKNEERLKAIEKHAANIEVEHDYNQKLITAHAAQLEAEDHLVRVRANMESALAQEIRNLAKEKSDIKERNIYMEKELASLTERIEESKKSLQFDKVKLIKLEDALDREEDKSQAIENCMKLDADVFKKLELERSKLTTELVPHRHAVVRAADEVNELEIMLDRTAKMYVETLREQLHLINRWKQSVCVLNQRDAGIQQTLWEIDTLREISREKMQLLRESEQFFENQANSNSQLEDTIKRTERKLVFTKDEHRRTSRELDAYQLEIKSQTRSLENLGRQIRQVRADAKRKRQAIAMKRKKVEDTKNDIVRVRNTLADIENQSLNVGGRLKQLEEMVEEEEKRKTTVMKETRRLQGLILRAMSQTSDLETEKKVLHLRKQNELKNSELLDAYEAREEKRLSEKRKVMFHQDIDISKCETRLERAAGTGGIDTEELDRKLKLIEDLEKLMSEKLQVHKLLQTEIANLEYDMRKVSNSLATDSVELERLRNKKQDLNLLMEGGEKQRKALISQNEERQVEESILGLRVSQAERLVASIGDKVYNLDKHRLQIEAAMKERKAEIRVHKEALNLQRRLAVNECSELRCAISERKSRIENLRIRYDISVAAMGGGSSEDGTPITTTYLKIQSAQERYLLQEEGDKLDATIRRTEHEIRSMENTLRVVNACNDKYKVSLEPVEEHGSEQTERRKLDDEMYAAVNALRQRREQLERTKDDLEKMRRDCVTFGEDAQKAKTEKDNKLWNVSNLERQIAEQNERIVRADKTLRKLFKDIQRMCELTGDEMILLQEKDIATRELQAQNFASLQRITEFTISHVEVEAYVKKLLATKNIALPCAQHLKPSPSSSRCDTTSEISDRSRSRGSLITASRESLGRVHTFEAEFSSVRLGSSRKNVSPAEQSTRSSTTHNLSTDLWCAGFLNKLLRMSEITEISSNKVFGGWQKVFSHESKELGCKMNFAVYLPPQAEEHTVPVIYWLSGLTCTEANFVQKAGAQKYAAEHGVILVAPDTSPRGLNIPGEEDSWDFGTGAGFYIDATKKPWAKHYRMYSYITNELLSLVNAKFPVVHGQQSIMGHSMGGHGALICAMKNPDLYKSISAFAPISNPTQSAWGRKAFTGYLGENEETWAEWDATLLAQKYNGPPLAILVDQGKDDNFLEQLMPEKLLTATQNVDLALILRWQEGYDHSYFFVSTFIEDHIKHHAKYLKN